MGGEARECGVKFIESVSEHQYNVYDTFGEVQTYGKILLCRRALAERASSLLDLYEQPYCRSLLRWVYRQVRYGIWKLGKSRQA
jgi:hypothetical protein